MIAEWYVLDEAATKLSTKLRRKITVNDIIGVAFEREFNLCCILKTTLARVVSNQDEVSAEYLMADEIDDRIAQIKRVKTYEDFYGYIKGNLKYTRAQVLTGPEVFNLTGIFELQLTFDLCDQLLGLNKPNKISGWFVSKDNQLFQIQMVRITGAVDEVVPSTQPPVQIILTRDAYKACLSKLKAAKIKSNTMNNKRT